jgi:hypothetical protein
MNQKAGLYIVGLFALEDAIESFEIFIFECFLDEQSSLNFC